MQAGRKTNFACCFAEFCRKINTNGGKMGGLGSFNLKPRRFCVKRMVLIFDLTLTHTIRHHHGNNIQNSWSLCCHAHPDER